jgi:Ca-activated chloride channel homolog
VKVRDVRGRGLSVPPGGGATRLYDALDYAFDEHVARLPGRKAVVLLTDGVDGKSFLADAAATLHAAEESDALVYVVQYDTSDDQAAISKKNPWASFALSRMKRDYNRADAYLRTIAAKTGGRVFNAAGDGDLAQSFASVVGELGRQYSLGYYPRDARREGRRRVGVRVRPPRLAVRARDSYVVGANSTERKGP